MRVLRALSALILLSTACLRSTDSIPAPGEGVVLTGSVVLRDLTTAETVPAEGAVVRVRGAGVSASADSRGFFVLPRLPLGRYRVVVERRLPAPALARILDPVNGLIDGQTIDLGTIELLGTGAVVGLVQREAGGAVPAPAAGALAVAAGTAFKGVAGEDGQYLLAGLPEGQIDVAAFLGGHEPGRAAGVQVSAGKKETVADMLLLPNPNLPAVTVRGRVTVVGAPDSGGVSVELLDETSGTRAALATSAADGGYQVEAPVGVYRFRFTKAGYRSAELLGVGVLPEGVLGLEPVLLLSDTAGDLDGDGIPDDTDPDVDNDGCPNTVDRFPRDPFSCLDTDGDSLPDEIDPDDDGDELTDAEELAPGLDGWITSPIAVDTDGDTVRDDADNCPTLPNPGQGADDCPRGQGGPNPPPPRLDGFTPAEGAPGEVVVLRGANFPAAGLAVRFGPDGSPGYVRDFRVRTQRELHVVIPANAESGPISVYGPFAVSTSTASFTVVQPPQIVEFIPRTARPAAGVVVVGRGFRAPDVMVGVEGAPLTAPSGPVETTSRNGETLELLRFVVPGGAQTGPISVRAGGRTGTSAVSLIVLRDLRIDSLLPNPAAVGATLTILGAGFSTADTGGSVVVRFTGVANDVLPTQARATSLTVTVPAGATNGPVTVVHPTGTASSPVPLVIDALAPYLTGMSTTLSPEGREIVLTGGNLAGANAVLFDGRAASFSAQSNNIRATVPAGATPGFISVGFPGGVVLQSPERLRILRMTMERTLAYFPGTTFRGADGRLYSVGTGVAPMVRAYDPTTLASIAGSEAPLAVPANDNNIFDVQPTPGGDFILAFSSTLLRTYLFAVPSFAEVGRCDLQPARTEARPAIDPAGGFVYLSQDRGVSASEVALLRLALADGSCERFLLGPGVGGQRYAAALPLSPTEVLVSHSNSGVGITFSSPGHPLDGTFTTPLGPPVLGSNNDVLVFGPGRGYVFSWSTFAGAGGLLRFTLGSAAMPQFLGNLAQSARQSIDLRWIYAPTQIWDLEAGGVLVDSSNLGETNRGFMADDVLWVPSGTSLRRWEIFE